MADVYDRFRDTATRLITKYGLICSISHKVTVPVADSSWKSTESSVTYNGIKAIVFDDDGTLFVNHNITGHTRILCVAPTAELDVISVGDTVTFTNGEVAQVKRFKELNPSLSGVVLWALLIV